MAEFKLLLADKNGMLVEKWNVGFGEGLDDDTFNLDKTAARGVVMAEIHEATQRPLVQRETLDQTFNTVVDPDDPPFLEDVAGIIEQYNNGLVLAVEARNAIYAAVQKRMK